MSTTESTIILKNLFFNRLLKLAIDWHEHLEDCILGTTLDEDLHGTDFSPGPGTNQPHRRGHPRQHRQNPGIPGTRPRSPGRPRRLPRDGDDRIPSRRPPLQKILPDRECGPMEQIAASSDDMAVVLGFVNVLSLEPPSPEIADAGDARPQITNAAALCHNGKLVDIYHKIYLPNYGVFDEQRYFKKGSICPVYRVGGVLIGVNICEDIWYPVGPTTVQCQTGAELIVNINASPFHAGKRAFREDMIAQRASDHGLTVAYVNTVGGQDELVFDGGSIVYDAGGNLLARAPTFEENLLVVDLNSRTISPIQARTHGTFASVLSSVGEPKTLSVSDTVPGNRSALNGRSKPLR
ncbi:MAG: hypothetical protein Ct9H300mP11_27640 [Chloroflexota bacterium]|nr:MAG: hypothetical protein Ct9H300mP11_27640 [Chloroflexota bacterium]